MQKLGPLTLTEGWDEMTRGGFECYQKEKWQGYYFWRLAAARETWGWCCSHSTLPSETPDCLPRSRWPGHLRHQSWLQHTVLSSKTNRKYIHFMSTNWGQSLKGVFYYSKMVSLDCSKNIKLLRVKMIILYGFRILFNFQFHNKWRKISFRKI